jgi:deoxyguanosine kinase
MILPFFFTYFVFNMTIQQKVILSIGSNLGNRFDNIQNAIQLIHDEIGIVLRVSKLYETPSWGFDSNDFYNCTLLLHTHFSASIIRKKIKGIEKKLGRERQNSLTYLPRSIDVDIIAINEDIVNNNLLTIPHKHMQDRLFVLLPMQDLQIDWKHPILQKTIPQLIAACSDKSNCKEVSQLSLPLPKWTISNLKYIVIEGNIGAGKTTLATKIAEDFNAEMVFERFAENPFLPKFYKDQNRYAFPLEMAFLADRYKQLSEGLSQFNLFKNFVVSDYYIFKSLIFAKITLQEDEFRLYKTLFDIVYKQITKPDLYIYLYQNTDRLLENIKKRGRVYEQEISESYLNKINLGYLDYIKSQTDLNVLVIDISEMDYVKNNEDYLKILQIIQNKIENL